MTTDQFISENRNAYVPSLALKASRWPEVDMPYALDQIAGWQKAREKLPSFAATEGIVYPPHLSMEQCSSELSARYKADLARRIAPGGDTLVDLTGGFGVDFAFMSAQFEKAVYVERNPQLCQIAASNFKKLGLVNATAVNGEASAYLQQMHRADLVFIDPARRDANGKKTVALADCTPNVVEMADTLRQKADVAVLKLSPMLDWHKAVADLGGNVAEVHVVSVEGECKELLLVVMGDGQAESRQARLVCANIRGEGTEMFENDGKEERAKAFAGQIGGLASMFLYEPNASIMKAGCFGSIARKFRLEAISANSHLFVSPSEASGFPGRAFRITAATTMNKRGLKAALAGVERANISVRNFPMQAEALRKRLKIGDGGSTYIFATTLHDGTKVLLITEKA